MKPIASPSVPPPTLAVVKLLARYRRHADSDAETLEVVVEAADYETAVVEARSRVAEGDDLLSVQTLED